MRCRRDHHFRAVELDDAKIDLVAQPQRLDQPQPAARDQRVVESQLDEMVERAVELDQLWINIGLPT